MRRISVLFPMPVSPTTAVMEPGLKSWLNPSMTFSEPSGYMKSTPENLTPSWPSRRCGSPFSSCGRSSSPSLSIDVIVCIRVGICLAILEIGLCTCPTSWRKAVMVPKVIACAAMPDTPHAKAVM